jgi:hypothetical protein
MAVCMKIDPAYQMVQSDLNIMEGYAVQFRYPGQSADKLEAKTALKAARVVRAIFRIKLGLSKKIILKTEESIFNIQVVDGQRRPELIPAAGYDSVRAGW